MYHFFCEYGFYKNQRIPCFNHLTEKGLRKHGGEKVNFSSQHFLPFPKHFLPYGKLTECFLSAHTFKNPKFCCLVESCIKPTDTFNLEQV